MACRIAAVHQSVIVQATDRSPITVRVWLCPVGIDCPTSCHDCPRFAATVADRYHGFVMARPQRSDMTMIEPVTVPLREDPPGVFRVGDTRVLLEVVVHAFRCGATPETIVQSYDTLSLPDVYAVLAYCLTHREQIDEYMRRCDSEAGHVRDRVQAAQPDQKRRPGTTPAKSQGRLACSGC